MTVLRYSQKGLVSGKSKDQYLPMEEVLVTQTAGLGSWVIKHQKTALYMGIVSKSTLSPHFEPLIIGLCPKTKVLKNYFQRNSNPEA